jgi:hypothetical protein
MDLNISVMTIWQKFWILAARRGIPRAGTGPRGAAPREQDRNRGSNGNLQASAHDSYMPTPSQRQPEDCNQNERNQDD